MGSLIPHFGSTAALRVASRQVDPLEEGDSPSSAHDFLRVGLSFRSKVVILNLALLTLSGWLFGMVRLKWIELRTHERSELYSQRKVPQWNFTPQLNPLPKPAAASEYYEVVQRDVFAEDRTPNVVIEAKPVPPPPPSLPMPPLPVYFGTMLIGDPVIILEFPKGTQKNYHAADTVGAFQLVSFDRERVVFDWDGKTVERTLEELRNGTPDAPQSVAAASSAIFAKTASSGLNVTVAAAEPSDNSELSTRLGMDTGVGIRLCLTGETSPAGTVVDGYRKRMVNGTVGPTCSWELMNHD
jgi:hypothetical protein